MTCLCSFLSVISAFCGILFVVPHVALFACPLNSEPDNPQELMKELDI